MITCEITKNQCRDWLAGTIAMNYYGEDRHDEFVDIESIVNRNGIYWKIKWVQGKTDDLNQYPETQTAIQVFPHVYQENISIARIKWNTENPS